MNVVNLVVSACGIPLATSIVVVAAFLALVVFYMTAVARQQHALTMLMPLTALPFLLGLIKSLFSFADSFALLDSEGANSLDMTTIVSLLMLAITPMMFGGLAMAPSFFLAVIGRMQLAYRANRPRKAADTARESRSATRENIEKQISEDTDSYLAQLTNRRLGSP